MQVLSLSFVLQAAVSDSEESSERPPVRIPSIFRCELGRRNVVIREVILGPFELLGLPPEKDFANQVYWWDHYQQECSKAKRVKGRYVDPQVAEYFAGHVTKLNKTTVIDCNSCRCHALLGPGMPAGWTKPSRGAVHPDHYLELFPWMLRDPHCLRVGLPDYQIEISELLRKASKL